MLEFEDRGFPTQKVTFLEGFLPLFGFLLHVTYLSGTLGVAECRHGGRNIFDELMVFCDVFQDLVFDRTFLDFYRIFAPIWAPFSLIFPHFCITFSSIDFVSIFHRFLNVFFIDFSSFVDAIFAPLPILANPEFEQQYGVLRRNPCF